jgi:chromosome segregation ATPase
LERGTTFLANLRKGCEDKKKEFEANEKLRMEEINGIQDTIKILNDDDSLEVFKKTLPSPGSSSSFVQTRRAEQKTVRQRTRNPSSFVQFSSSQMLDNGKFDKLARMVRNMVVTLQADQKNDDTQLKWCKGELRETEQALESVDTNLGSLQQKIDQTLNEVKVAQEAIVVLKADVKSLDEAVAEASKERKEQQALFVQTQSELNLASGLLEKAAERMKQVHSLILRI